MVRWHQGAAKLRYAVEGTAGPSLVLFHELGGSMEHWDDVVSILKKDFRILRYDLRGAGQSETPSGPYSIENGHLVDLLELLQVTGLEPPYHFASAASGAVVPVAFALKSPLQVASITLLAPALGISDPIRRRRSMERAKLMIESGMEAVTDTSLAISYPEEMRVDKARFERFRNTMLRTDPRGFAYGSYALASSTLEAQLGELEVPVQFLAGRHDALRTPDYVRSLTAKVKSASFEEVEVATSYMCKRRCWLPKRYNVGSTRMPALKILRRSKRARCYHRTFILRSSLVTVVATLNPAAPESGRDTAHTVRRSGPHSCTRQIA